MMDRQRMSKDVTEHRYCIMEHIFMKICRLFPLFVNYNLKMFNHQLPVYAII